MPASEAISDFTNSVGINTSITQISSDYQNYPQMMNALSYLGVTSVRDTYDNPYTIAEYQQMANQLGLKFDFFIALGSASPDWQLYEIGNNPSIVAYVEGYNESDSWWQTYNGQTGIAATRAVQQDIYNYVKSHPSLANAGVIQATFANQANFQTYGNMSAYADYAGTHSYFGTGNPPGAGIQSQINLADASTPGKPTITTESGYFTMPGSVHGVSQLVQAKYELNLLFDQAQAGVKLTYLWELADTYADPGNTNSEDHFGIFNTDWTPKLAAVALHNLLVIMQDKGTPTQAAQPIDYTLSGMPASARSALYHKSDGTAVLVIWNDVRLSGPTSQTDIAVAPVPVTLTLGQQYARISVFDPLVGTAAVQELGGASTAQLSLLDHPIIIELGTTGATSSGPDLEAPTQLLTSLGHTVQVSGASIQLENDSASTVTITSRQRALSMLDSRGQYAAYRTNGITITGSTAAINAELATLTYTASDSAADTVSIAVIDSHGASASRSIGASVIVPPVAGNSGGPFFSTPASLSTVTGSTVLLPNLSLADIYAATASGNVTWSARDNLGILQVSASAATVSGNGSATIQVSGSLDAVTQALGTLTYTAGAATGQDQIGFNAVDQSGFSSASQTIISVTAASIGVPSAIVLPFATPGATPGVTSGVTPDVTNATNTTTTATNTATTPTATPTASLSPASTPQAADGQTVYRFFDTATGSQFLTSDPNERNILAATRPDLIDEGPAFQTTGDSSGSAPVFRFFDKINGTHFFTVDSGERDTLRQTRSDLTFEGTAFDVHTTAQAGDVAVYRFFDTNNGTHLYTDSGNEKASILQHRPDLVYEGTAFYVA